MKKCYFIYFFLLLVSSELTAQEWKSIRRYKKETGFSQLQEGCWLKKDRKKDTRVWNEANIFNLTDSKGVEKYKTLIERRDFYVWFDKYRLAAGHEAEWIGYATIISGQFSNLDNAFIRIFIVRSKEVVRFVNCGSKNVFEYAFPLLRDMYLLESPLTGGAAIQWDAIHGRAEQCTVLDPLYKNVSVKALKKLNKMAKGKGIYALGAPKIIRFEGEISDCELRVAHMYSKLKPYYKSSLIVAN